MSTINNSWKIRPAWLQSGVRGKRTYATQQSLLKLLRTLFDDLISGTGNAAMTLMFLFSSLVCCQHRP